MHKRNGLSRLPLLGCALMTLLADCGTRSYALKDGLSPPADAVITNGATFVGLIPKAPLVGNDIRSCPFETGIYRADARRSEDATLQLRCLGDPRRGG
jgi:hypothetical protein